MIVPRALLLSCCFFFLQEKMVENKWFFIFQKTELKKNVYIGKQYAACYVFYLKSIKIINKINNDHGSYSGNSTSHIFAKNA
jgi:hypothetical protein